MVSRSVSGDGSETHKNGTLAGGGAGRNSLDSSVFVVSNASKRVKLEFRMLRGGGLVLAGDGRGELEADETGEG